MLLLPGAGARGLELNAPVPEFTAPDLAGATRTLADFPGRVTLLLFWQPDNPRSCRVLCEIADLQGVYERSALATIVSGAHQKAEIEEALKGCRNRPPVLLDPDRVIFGAYQIVALPTLMLVGPDRLLKYKIAGLGLQGVGEVQAHLDAVYGREKALAAAPAGPPDVVRRFGMAQQLLKAGMQAQAERILESLTMGHPEFRPAWVSLGYCRVAGNRPGEAQAAFETAMALDARAADVAAGMAWVSWRRDDAAGAAEWAARTNGNDPNHALADEIRRQLESGGRR